MMRKFLAILVAMLLLIPAAGTAETDLSAMTDEELVQLRDAANLELAARHPAEGPLATWEMEGCRIDLIAVERGVDRDNNPGFSLRFAFTNTGTETSTYIHYAQAYIYQDGVECEWAFVNGADSSTQFTRVQPGGTFDGVIYGFLPNSDSATIDIEITAASYPYQSAGTFTVKLPD